MIVKLGPGVKRNIIVFYFVIEGIVNAKLANLHCYSRLNGILNAKRSSGYGNTRHRFTAFVRNLIKGNF